MIKESKSIALCRVSSDEQLKNNSLNRQNKTVNATAKKLNTTISRVWSGSVSSKQGTNIYRKDLQEMKDYCKKHKNSSNRIKYLIVDEPDRFMRSIDEAFYFEVDFKQLGVTIYYTDDALNGSDILTKLQRFMKYFQAEASNDERQRKSINGQTTALVEGRYTFCPKPGYMKGTIPGIHILHPDRTPALRYILKKLASGVTTPTKALKDLNESSFTKNHAPYKMDKFRKITKDPYYAGIIEINKQVQVRNENGLHEPLIRLEEHNSLVRIMDGKAKNQTGPNMKGNPLFPLSNLIEDDGCVDCKNKGRFVGFKHSNGKSNKIYEKYRCRTCGKYISKDNLHNQIEVLFSEYEMSDETQNKILKALDTVWKRDSQNILKEISQINISILKLKQDIKLLIQTI